MRASNGYKHNLLCRIKFQFNCLSYMLSVQEKFYILDYLINHEEN